MSCGGFGTWPELVAIVKSKLRSERVIEIPERT
jgi:hypothetical protein